MIIRQSNDNIHICADAHTLCVPRICQSWKLLAAGRFYERARLYRHPEKDDFGRKSRAVFRSVLLDDGAHRKIRHSFRTYDRRSSRHPQRERQRRHQYNEGVLSRHLFPARGDFREHLGPRPSRRGRSRNRRRSESARRHHRARTRRQHQALSPVRQEFRIFFRRPVRRGQNGRGVGARRAEKRRRSVGQTFLRKQPGTSPYEH